MEHLIVKLQLGIWRTRVLLRATAFCTFVAYLWWSATHPSAEHKAHEADGSKYASADDEDDAKDLFHVSV